MDLAHWLVGVALPLDSQPLHRRLLSDALVIAAKWLAGLRAAYTAQELPTGQAARVGKRLVFLKIGSFFEPGW